jgi:hypothetical protein
MASKQDTDGVKVLLGKFLDVAYEFTLLSASILSSLFGIIFALGTWVCSGIKNLADRLLAEKRDKDNRVRYVKHVDNWAIPEKEKVTNDKQSS